MRSQSVIIDSNPSLEEIQIDFMAIFYDFHKEETDSKKEKSAQYKLAARRAMEIQNERRALEEQLKITFSVLYNSSSTPSSASATASIASKLMLCTSSPSIFTNK